MQPPESEAPTAPPGPGRGQRAAALDRRPIHTRGASGWPTFAAAVAVAAAALLVLRAQLAGPAGAPEPRPPVPASEVTGTVPVTSTEALLFLSQPTDAAAWPDALPGDYRAIDRLIAGGR